MLPLSSHVNSTEVIINRISPTVNALQQSHHHFTMIPASLNSPRRQDVVTHEEIIKRGCKAPSRRRTRPADGAIDEHRPVLPNQQDASEQCTLPYLPMDGASSTFRLAPRKLFVSELMATRRNLQCADATDPPALIDED
jgi:hypothetical protein